MDESTEGVLLHVGFVLDILEMYQNKPEDYARLKEFTAGIDLQNRDQMIPITVYNDMCNYILQEIGPANTRVLGTRLGESVFHILQAQNMVSDNPTPLELMQAVADVCHVAIQDPKRRGYEIVEHTPGRIVMRRTQTFNRIVQLGILSGIMNKSKVPMPRVQFLKEITNGNPYDEYVISWMA